MTKPTAKIQITIETLQRTVIRKRQFRSISGSNVLELPQFQDETTSAHLPARTENTAANTDSDTLDDQMEK